MTTEMQTLDILLRPYADSDDPRFDALRGKHDFESDYLGGYVCKVCDVDNQYEGNPIDVGYCLRTDLGAGVRVAAACGLVVVLSKYSDGQWKAVLGLAQVPVGEPHTAWANEPEEAFWTAFVAAVPLP